jgi:hypothetical protein
MRPGDDPHDDFRPRGLPIEPTFGPPEELQAEPEPPARGPMPAAIAIIAVVLLIIWWL